MTAATVAACERASAELTMASDEMPAEERSQAACVAGERNDRLRGRGTPPHTCERRRRCERASASERVAKSGLRGRGTP
jgi:hypothetical protein